jgi:hypothetical protein
LLRLLNAGTYREQEHEVLELDAADQKRLAEAAMHMLSEDKAEPR